MPTLNKDIGRSTGSVLDSAFGIYKLKLIEEQIEKDTLEYGLSKARQNELRDAYILEDTYGGGVHAFRYWTNKSMKLLGRRRFLRSSREILEAAQKEKLFEDKEPNSTRKFRYPNDTWVTTDPEREISPSSLLDYYKKEATVPVKAHQRDGHEVKAHQRSWPDGDLGNNLK